jgi:hypothetical protein
MGLLVLGALGRAGFADLGAQGADFLGVHATAGHEASRETADCSAVDVVAAHRDFKRSLEACGRPDWRRGGRKMPSWTAWNRHLHRCLGVLRPAHSGRLVLAASDHQG